MFHDESPRIIQSMNKTRSEKATKSGPSSSQEVARRQHVGPLPRTGPQPFESQPLPIFSMLPPAEDIGLNFFMKHFTPGDPAVSQLSYVPDFYTDSGHANPGLHNSLIAAGLAGYAKASGKKDILEHATKSYIAAVKGINTALMDPKQATHDSTLLSIIMAAMFEVLLLQRSGGMSNATKHLEGAVSLAALNLQRVKQTPITKRLLTTLIQSVIVNCWIQNTPLPPKFMELRRQIAEHINPYSVHGMFLDIILELIRFRHALREGQYDQPMAIIRRALEIDRTLAQFANDMPAHAKFDTIQLGSDKAKALAFNGFYHGT